jgi:hypothetical protein
MMYATYYVLFLLSEIWILFIFQTVKKVKFFLLQWSDFLHIDA